MRQRVVGLCVLLLHCIVICDHFVPPAVAAAPDVATTQEGTGDGRQWPIGVWVAVDGEKGLTSVLELSPDGTGMLVREKDGVIGDPIARWGSNADWPGITDHLVRWVRHGDWVGFAVGSSVGVFDAVRAGDKLKATRRAKRPETVIYERTEEQEYLRLLPSHGPPPEPPGTRPSVVDVWAYSSPDDDEMIAVELKSNGMGVCIAVGGGTALGSLFRWRRAGDTITTAASTPYAKTFEMRFEDEKLLMRGGRGQETVLRRSNDPKHAQIVDVAPLPPEPPRQPSDAEGQRRYYAEGATEAVLAFGSDAVFEIGYENLAPPEVRKWLEALRDSARHRIEQLSKTYIAISPDGKSIILSVYRRGDGRPITYIWNDWRQADAVEELRGGGRFLSNQYLYLGNGQVLDRSTGRRYLEPPVDARGLDVAPEGKWVGTDRDKQTIQIGTLTRRGPRKLYEVKVDGYGPLWARRGRYFVVGIIRGGVRVFDAKGQETAVLEGDWRLGSQISDRQFFITTEQFAQAAMMTIGKDGSVEVGDVRNLRCRPERVSPSGKYVIGLGFRRTGDRFDVDRTPLSDPDAPLPPRPPYGRFWISWATDDSE
ncbi:MAG: hypothetical protein IH830_11000 [Planctomycetes bacterium]|nr:hypothetical protein [Planctomycetota bacterium]